MVKIPTRGDPLPKTAGQYKAFDAPHLRITQEKGPCHVPGKVYGETARQYRVLTLGDDFVVRVRFGKNDKTHLEPCKYCPPEDKLV